MTQEDKDLLLKDLCARLPHGIIVNVNGNNEKVDEINPFEGIITCGFQSFDVNDIKPYLRSMSSMTKKEKEEIDVSFSPTGQELFSLPYVDWLNAHHFDYRGLIEKDLALEAPEDMYNLDKK